jgi:hypothetical protein
MAWLAVTDNLMMKEAVYEARRGGSLLLVTWSIVGASTVIGGIAAWTLQRR